MQEQKAALLDIKPEEIIKRNPFAAYIGIELLEVLPGHARARIALEQHHENIYWGVHGGCAFSLADTLAGIAAASYGGAVTTVDASINYLRPVMGSKNLYCAADVIRKGTKISVIRTELTNDEGMLLIDGSFTYYHLPQSDGSRLAKY